jgi:hypothetical protein
LQPGFTGIVCGFALTAIGDGPGRPGYTAGASLAARRGQQGQVADRLQSASVTSIIFAPVLGVSLYHVDPALGYILNVALLAGMLLFVSLNIVLRHAGREAVSEELVEATEVDRLC